VKRWSLALAAVAAGVNLALIACGSDAATPPTISPGPSGTAELNTSAPADIRGTVKWAVWSYDASPEFRTLKEGFEKKYPNAKVEVIDTAANDYSAELNVRLAAKNDTDVLTIKTAIDYANLTSKQQLIDISDVVKASNPDKLKAQEAYSINGSYSALTYRTDFWVLFYNTGIFDAKGEKYPARMTWAEYEALVRKMVGTAPDGNPQYGAYFHSWRSVVVGVPAAQLGKNIVQPDYRWMKPSYEMALRLQDAKAIHTNAEVLSGNLGYKSELENGYAATVPQGTWLISRLVADTAAGQYRGKWAIAPIAQQAEGTDITTAGEPTGLALSKFSTNQSAAKALIAYAASEEAQVALATIGVTSALATQSVVDAYFAAPGMPTDAASKAAFMPTKVALDIPPDPDASKVDALLTEIHAAILGKNVTVDEGLAVAAHRVETEVLRK
jgi:multiple sugar transport system substrate-binding protein